MLLHLALHHVHAGTKRCITTPPIPPHPNPRAAANNTWWAIHASKRPAKSGPLQIRECGYGPLLNFVGTTYSAPAGGNSGISPRVSPPPSRLFPGWCTQTTPWHVEQLRPGATLQPRDLYTSMLRTRRTRLGLPEAP